MPWRWPFAAQAFGALCVPALPQDGFSLMAELCLAGAVYTLVPSTWVLAPVPRLLAGRPALSRLRCRAARRPRLARLNARLRGNYGTQPHV